MWNIPDHFIQSIRNQSWAQRCNEQEFWDHLLEWIKGGLLPDFLGEVSGQVDEITEIEPDSPAQQILSVVTRHMVEFLGALSASVRIYDPGTKRMLSYGSYPPDEEARETYIPLDGTIAGEVVRTGLHYVVPNILKEELYQDKERVQKKGAFSILAVPISLPRFSPHEPEMVGVIQLYYKEKDRLFLPLEIKMANLMARRLSFVMARKKILALYRLNEKKEAIVQKIFLKLGSREGVKMKEVFNRVMPELADIISLQSCALFAVTEDKQRVSIEAGYPEVAGYHGIGKSFSVSSEPAFELVLGYASCDTESPYEIVTPSYVVITDPLKSRYISKNMKSFAGAHNINSILYVPLNVGEDITHFMTFDALDQRKTYSGEEIEIFVFLGRELMKAQRMERLDDILHDFKNPAIATAGFARRLKRLIEHEESLKESEKIKRYLDVLLEETSRLQEMALSIYHVGKEQVANLTSIVLSRFDINKEVIKELLKQNVVLEEGPFHDPLYVQCYPLHVERVLDNLLNNATNAIPLKGGVLSIRTFPYNGWACVEITNSGHIPEEERRHLLEGEGRGRGIYITHRIVRLLRGKIEINVDKDKTQVIVRLPLYEAPTVQAK
jgi:signal transduction histidine kinase